jgi:hypothetical protein
MWTRLAFLKTCGGLKVEGRMSFDEADPATLESAEAVESKERHAAATAVNFIVKKYRMERSSIEQLRNGDLYPFCMKEEGKGNLWCVFRVWW